MTLKKAENILLAFMQTASGKHAQNSLSQAKKLFFKQKNNMIISSVSEKNFRIRLIFFDKYNRILFIIGLLWTKSAFYKEGDMVGREHKGSFRLGC